MRLAACALLLAGAVLAGTATTGLGADDVIVVTLNTDPTLAPGCRPGAVARVMQRFIDDFNAGDAAGAADAFALSDRNRWFSMSEVGVRTWTVFRKRDLAAYVRERHAQGERLQLLMVNVAGEGVSHAGIQFALTREANDVRPGLGGPLRLAAGKGALYCRSRKIFRWSSGMTMDGKIGAWPCPRPHGWHPGDAVIACSRT
jgi:hypothetical protein